MIDVGQIVRVVVPNAPAAAALWAVAVPRMPERLVELHVSYPANQGDLATIELTPAEARGLGAALIEAADFG